MEMPHIFIGPRLDLLNKNQDSERVEEEMVVPGSKISKKNHDAFMKDIEESNKRVTETNKRIEELRKKNSKDIKDTDFNA